MLTLFCANYNDTTHDKQYIFPFECVMILIYKSILNISEVLPIFTSSWCKAISWLALSQLLVSSFKISHIKNETTWKAK